VFLIRKKEKLNKIIDLSDKCLQDPLLQNYEELTILIRDVNKQARKGKLPRYIVENFQKEMSFFSIDNNYKVPEHLTELSSLMRRSILSLFRTINFRI